MPTAPKNFSPDEKKIFRNLVKQMQVLNIYHDADLYQIERATRLIHKSRLMENDIALLGGDKDELQYLQKYTQVVTALNSTLDKLGISNTKRNPVKRDRGRPKKGEGAPTDDTDRKRWLEVVK